jgi:hypothetical protein
MRRRSPHAVWASARVTSLAALVAVIFGAAANARAQATAAVRPESRPRGFSFGAAMDVPLSYDDASSRGEGSQGEETFRSPRLSLSLRYSPPDTRWFGRVSVHRYLDSSRKAPWNPDFSYSFGYDDYRPGTISVSYDNNGGNRFQPKREQGETITRFEEGSLSAVYKIPISKRIESIFVPHPDDRLSASLGLHVTPRFRQDASLERGQWKKVVSLGVRNRFYRWWYAEGRVYYYPGQGQQQPWDPDYTYGFGYFDWHPGKVSVQYNNYAGNRFPGRESTQTTSWRDGALTVSWSHAW